MSRWSILLAIVVFGLSLSSVLTLHAQVGGIPSPYGPPPLSPWLNLYQKQGGPVDNYHMFVQPQVQLRDSLQMQQTGIQRNAAGMAAMGERFQSQIDAASTMPDPTGASTGFLNHTIFFNNFRGVGLGPTSTMPGAPFGGMSGGMSQAAMGANSGAASRNSWSLPAASTRGSSGAGR